MRRLRQAFPLTLLGLCAMAVAAAALKWLAYAQMDLVILIIGYAMIALPLLCALLVLVATFFLRRHARRFPAAAARSVDTERELVSAFNLSALRFVPFVTVKWSIEMPTTAHAKQRAEKGRAIELVRFEERGDVGTITRVFEIADVFGLSRLSFRATQNSAYEVMPNTGALRELFALSSFAGGDETAHPMGVAQGDRTEIRRYAAGDPARFIHWKAFARTRRLLVRQPERALVRSRRTIAYLVAGPDDDATAGIARAALQSRAFGEEWSFGADGSVTDANELGKALRLIVESGRKKDEGAAGLAAFFARAERSGPASAVLFVPARKGDWLARVLAVLRTRQPMRIVIGVDALSEKRVLPKWKRLFIRASESKALSMDELEEVVGAFRRARCEVLILDRKSGRVWSDARRSASNKKREGITAAKDRAA